MQWARSATPFRETPKRGSICRESEACYLPDAAVGDWQQLQPLPPIAAVSRAESQRLMREGDIRPQSGRRRPMTCNNPCINLFADRLRCSGFWRRLDWTFGSYGQSMILGSRVVRGGGNRLPCWRFSEPVP